MKMTDDKSISLVNLGSLAKPANTLIEKVSSAVGGLCKPWQVERTAKAETKVALIKANTEREITDLKRRAMYRFVEEEAQKQENMESIVKKTLLQLNENATPNKMENDWLTNFFDKSRIISDTEMQDLWARVLAGEANAPGKFSKRTVNFLGELDKKEAELFQKLCSFGWIIDDDFVPLIFDLQEKIYNKKGIDFESLSHLDSIGLIHFESSGNFAKMGFPKNFSVFYRERPLMLQFRNNEKNDLTVGYENLTVLGKELATICNDIDVVDGFFDYVKEKWKQFLVVV
jgi:hypothetical protein